MDGGNAANNGKDEDGGKGEKRSKGASKQTGEQSDSKQKQSPSVSPNRRNRREDLTHFEEMVNRTSVPRKSHAKNKN